MTAALLAAHRCREKVVYHRALAHWGNPTDEESRRTWSWRTTTRRRDCRSSGAQRRPRDEDAG